MEAASWGKEQSIAGTSVMSLFEGSLSCRNMRLDQKSSVSKKDHTLKEES